MINEFRGPHAWASNFYPAPMHVQGSLFRTNEHFFAACKSSDPTWCNRIAGAATAAGAKKLGQKCPIRPDWNQIRISVMASGLWYKFFQHLDLQAKLLATYPQHLVEGNYWHDNFWGDCKCSKCESVQGRNALGVLLMAHRDTFYTMGILNG